MKSVLISIKPKYVELIANGEKTIEVRKTAPREVPFKVYIYETKGATEMPWVDEDGHFIYKGRGQVIGEFVCDRIYEIKNLGSSFMIGNDIALTNRITRESCLEFPDLRTYLKDKNGYAWHISDLKIYDKPMLLEELGVDKAPQSWRYV